MSVKKKVYSRLIEEQKRSGLDITQFVAQLDAAAKPKVGAAYQFGAVLAEFTALYNKETVCRIIRQFKHENRVK